MTRWLRWVAAGLLTWALSATVLSGLVQKYGLESPGFAVVLNMALPLWVVAFFFVADPGVDHAWLEAYFKPRKWERDGRRYRPLGVLQFQAVLKALRIGVFSLRPADFRVRNDADLLARLERETRAAEAAHGLCFAVVVGFAVYAAATGRLAGAAWLLVTGTVCQLYPVLLQRHHRPRWRRVLRRRDAVHRAAAATRRSPPATG